MGKGILDWHSPSKMQLNLANLLEARTYLKVMADSGALYVEAYFEIKYERFLSD